jgi:tripartite-type tricarboxylate transporter receptor subunit TctC
MTIRSTASVMALALLAATASVACADEAEFYRGRTVTIVVGHETGTGFDLYGRLIGRHLGRHLPGSPQVVVQNMPGGGGLNAAQWLYNVAPKDGSTLAIFAHTAPFEQLLGDGRAKVDGSRLTWIGNLEETVAICAVTTASGIVTAEDFLTKGVLIGSSGGPLGVFPTTLRKLAGANLKMVHGYKGSADVKLAMQRGEVQSICGISISTLKSQWSNEMASGAVRVVLQFGRVKHPELPQAEHIYDRARTPEERQVFDLVYGATSLGRPLAGPPDLAPSRTRTLRTAFAAMIRHDELIADAKKSRLDLSPATGEEVEALVKRLYAAPKDVVDRARSASRID